jgi:hypothetical protein
MGRHKKDDKISTKDLEGPVIFIAGDDDRVLDRSNLPPVPPGIHEVPEGSRIVFCIPTPPDTIKAKKRAVVPVTIVDKRKDPDKKTTDPSEIVIYILNRIFDVSEIGIGGIKYTGLNPRSIKTWIEKGVLHLYVAGDGAEQKITVHGQNLESVREALETRVRKDCIGWRVK